MNVTIVDRNERDEIYLCQWFTPINHWLRPRQILNFEIVVLMCEIPQRQSCIIGNPGLVQWYISGINTHIYIHMCIHIYISLSRYIPMISLNISPLKKQFDGWFTEAWWHLPPGERSFTTPVFVAWWMIGADVISWDLTMEVWWNVGFHGILGFYEIETFLKVGFSEMLTGCRWT